MLYEPVELTPARRATLLAAGSEFLDVSEPLKLAVRAQRARGAGGEIIKTEAEIIEDQMKALDVWIQKFVQQDPGLEAAFFSVPDERFVVQQLREDLSMHNLRSNEESRKLQAIVVDQHTMSANASSSFVPVIEAAHVLTDYTGKSSSAKDKLLKELEMRCEALGRAFAARLALDYRAAYSEGRKELHLDEMLRLRARLADAEQEEFADSSGDAPLQPVVDVELPLQYCAMAPTAIVCNNE